MKIGEMFIRDLRPYENNARTHSKTQIRPIAKSIKRFGFNSPIGIDDDNRIVCGHARVEAAKLLGMGSVSTCRLSHMSDAEKRGYIIAAR